MRAIVCCGLIGLLGCSKPAPVAIVVAPDEPVAVPAAEAPVAVAPRPREICYDPYRAARRESQRNDKDPVLSGLARGEIKAGDPVEPLIRLNPHYDVLRSGDFVFMRYPAIGSGGLGGTGLTAKNGKLVRAVAGSCVYSDEFFRDPDLTEEDWAACSKSFDIALRKKLGLPEPPPPAPIDWSIPPPREVARPAP